MKARLPRLIRNEDVRRYALHTKWSAEGAMWLAHKNWWDAIDVLAASERRSPYEVSESILALAVKQEQKSRGKAVKPAATRRRRRS